MTIEQVVKDLQAQTSAKDQRDLLKKSRFVPSVPQSPYKVAIILHWGTEVHNGKGFVCKVRGKKNALQYINSTDTRGVECYCKNWIKFLLSMNVPGAFHRNFLMKKLYPFGE
jgi:hypothetical protein